MILIDSHSFYGNEFVESRSYFSMGMAESSMEGEERRFRRRQFALSALDREAPASLCF